MEFGRVPAELLDTIHFSLPADAERNNSFLSTPPYSNPKLYIGCAKWGRKEWVGKIYPEKTKEKDFLQHYVKHYNCIELNATHYKIYEQTTIRKWAAFAKGRDFLFCPKMYQGVTHRGSLSNKGFLTDAFLESILAFEEHLGPIFIQLSDSFSPNRKQELFTYLSTLPKDLSFYVEVRHNEWFTNALHRNDLFSFLANEKIGAVITDTAGRRDCCHMEITMPNTMIRYVGNSLHPTDYTRVDDWINRINYWLQKGMQEIYFFMHMHDETYSPELTVYLVNKLNSLSKLQLQKPEFIQSTTQQTLLF